MRSALSEESKESQKKSMVKVIFIKLKIKTLSALRQKKTYLANIKNSNEKKSIEN